jgi:hypothetical protein
MSMTALSCSLSIYPFVRPVEHTFLRYKLQQHVRKTWEPCNKRVRHSAILLTTLETKWF